MSPAHCDKNPSDFQGRGTAFIATKPRPPSRVALRQKTVRLPGIRQLDIATSRPTSRDSTWEHRKNGHFLNCGEQTNGVRVVASHGVQGLEQWEDGGHVAMVSLHNEMSQQQPTSERTGTPPTSTEQDVVVEPALKLAAQSHRKDPHTGRLGHGRCRRPIMLAVREAIGMLSQPHQADRTVSPLQDTSTYPRDRLTHGKARACWAYATYAQERWTETKRITDLFTEPGGLLAIERGTRMTTTDSPGDTDHELLRRLEQVATTLFGGHFTIMRFGSNWRVGFTAPNDRHDITAMAEGRTFAEAADKALQRIKEAVWADQAKRRADVEESMSPSTRAAPAGSGIHERTTWTL